MIKTNFSPYQINFSPSLTKQISPTLPKKMLCLLNQKIILPSLLKKKLPTLQKKNRQTYNIFDKKNANGAKIYIF